MSAAESTLVVEGRSWRVVLDRPQQGNALSNRLVRELDEVFERASREDVQALILEGRGRHFCTGFDLSSLATESDDSLLARFVRIELLLQRVARAPFLTVAVARGRAMGAGADLFAACRLRLAGADASFAFPGARGFGLVLGTRRLAALVGVPMALRWVESACAVSAAEARDAGLASELADVPEQCAKHVADALAVPAPVRLALQSASEPDAARHDADDLASLVRSAAAPGLRDRIAAYVARSAAARRPA
ncbi:enoyl-CoA hydratase/isomerase family protein [Variovorax sp. KK3]|uniref:enoyl-CoA hydratase/isomerase family protein n=1 Tax=Variovorax sp. KK3 TaxID=1855728 RepID=UPI00097C0FBD|nr:enoyl-CoA hydratase/isomerase family protein [Variovorax sp. KK3]